MGAAIIRAPVTAIRARSASGACARIRTTAPTHSAAPASAMITIAPGARPRLRPSLHEASLRPLGGADEGAGLPAGQGQATGRRRGPRVTPPNIDMSAGWPERVGPGNIAGEST